MALDLQMMMTCVRIIGDWPTGVSNQTREAIGTGFLLSVPNDDDPSIEHCYVVTAHHVLDGQLPGRVQVQAPNPAAPLMGTMHEPITVDGWMHPVPMFDVAFAEFPPPGDERDFIAGSAERDLMPIGEGDAAVVAPSLGATMHYIGILTALDRPMARSGTVGALAQLGVTHCKPEYDYICHLVDCRSYGGFSGSPCFVEIPLPSLTPTAPPYGTESDEPLGRMRYKALQFGMFTEHLTDDDDISRYGVGVVLPGSQIKVALQSNPMKDERKQRSADMPKRDEGRLTGARRSDRKRDMDERVSLAPLSAEEALRGLLATPPHNQDES